MSLEEKTREELMGEIHRLEELEKECREARIALQKSEELCRAQFQSQDSIKLILNRADGEVIEANDAACDFFAFKRNDMLGKRIADIISLPHDQIAELLAASRGRINTTCQIQHRLENGESRDIEVALAPIVSNGENLLSCVVHDISERISEKKALQESRQQLQTILDNSSALLITRASDGMILESNRTCEQLLGFSREELLGRTTPELGIYPADERQKLVAEVAEKGHAHNIQFSLRRRDGVLIETYFSTVPFAFNGEQCLLTVVNDITERNRALEALRISDERFQEALNCSRHVLYRRNARTDSYDYISPYIEELSGYPYEQFRRYSLKEISELIHPDDREQLVTLIAEAGRLQRGVSSPVKLEYRLRKANGEYCWLNDWTTICFDGQGQVESMVGSVYDITDRKLAELELREREERLRVIFETSHSGILMVDARGFVSFANSRMAEMFGCPLAELIGSYYPDRLHPADFQACVSMMQQMISGEMSQVIIEKQYLRCDGSSFWGYLSARRLEAEDGTLRALVGIITDITARKEAEEALLESEQRYRRLVELSPDAIFIHQEDRFVFANLTGAELLGAERCEQLYDREVLDFVHPKYRDMVTQRIAKLQVQAGPNPLAELLLLKFDGSVVPAESTSVAFTHCGRPAVLSVVRDISERKQMQDDLLKAQQLESLGVLAGGIAHDFNNLLTGILGNLSFARMQIDPAPEIAGRLDECEKAAMQASELTRQLLTFARGGEPVRKLFAPDRMIRNSASFMLRGSNVRCVTELAEDLWSLEADEGQLSQALNNLLLNAVQAMPGGGEIWLSAANETLQPGNSQHLPPGTYIRIEVEDHGCGIPQENMGKIFDPYFSTKEKGNGLGLASVYSIVKRHGGGIGVSSIVGKGSCFRLLLPASPAREEELDLTAEAAAPARGGRVLVMDDEDFIRRIVTEILEFLGYEAESCADGRAALELYRTARELGAPFDAVILDLTVPGGMGGKEAAPLLREIDPAAVLIVSSGYSDDPVIARFHEYGFDGAIPKPFDADTLARELAQLVPGRR